MMLLLLSLALAGVPDETWTAVEGQPVLLVNPQGKQIRGTILRYEGDRVVLERHSDGRTVVVLKHEVSSVVLIEPPTPEEPPAEEPAEQPDSVKDAIVGAGGLVAEAGGEVLDEVRSTKKEPSGKQKPPKEPAEVVEPAVEPAEPEVASTKKESSTSIEDRVPPSLGDEIVVDVIVAPDDGGSDEGAPDEGDSDEGDSDEGAPDEGAVVETEDPPVIVDTVVVSAPAAPEGAELGMSPISMGRSYDQGLRAGREAAGDESTVLAFTGGLCGTAAMTVVPCAFNPLLGCMTGVVAGTATPAAVYLLEPTPPYETLPDGEAEYSRGYVDGYTRELRRRRLVMAAIGSGSGLVLGGLTGFVVYAATQ